MKDVRRKECSIFNDIGIRGLVWLFVGVIYGFLFVSIAEILRDFVSSPLNILAATVGASALTALFYGSVRLVALIANIVFVATLLFFLFGPDPGYFSPLELVGIAAFLGLTVGAVYGRLDHKSRIFCADAKVICGLFTGIVTALIAGLVMFLVGDANKIVYPWLVMLLAPIAGAIYVGTACWFVHHLQNLLPPIGDGALVGLGVGATTGGLFLVIVGAVNPDFIGHREALASLERIHEVLGVTLLSSAASCFLLGGIRAARKMAWYKL